MVHVCLVVSAGAGSASAVIAAVQSHHPDASFVAVWAGDPQLRPAPPEGARWIDSELAEPSEVGWNRLLIAMSPPTYAMTRAAAAVADFLDGSAPGVLVLRLGDVAVSGPIAAVPMTGIALIERCAELPPADGLVPSQADYLDAGRYGTAVIGFAADSSDLARAISQALIAGHGLDDPSGLVGSVVERSTCPVALIGGANVVGWSQAPLDTSPSIADLTHVDAAEAWHISFGDARPRTLLSMDPVLMTFLDRTSQQWAHHSEPIRLPGGVTVDGPIRNLMRTAIDAWRRGEGPLPPDPFGTSGSALLEWLETPWPPWGPDIGRYWSEVRRLRPDLLGAFPHPEGADHDEFVEWASTSWRFDDRSPLIRTGSHRMRTAWHDLSREPGGINVIGYLGFDKSLGDVARRIHQALTAAAVPTAALHYHRSGSPTSADTPELTNELRYDTNLVVINADQFPLLGADYGPVLFDGRHTIGYWFWDIAYVPPSLVDALELVDEVWVASEFTATNLRRVTDKPVRVVDVPVPEPTISVATRAELGVPADRFVFLVTFDHLSVTERKNPIGAVMAFRRAFPNPSMDGPVLVVKSLNREHRWAEHERLRLAAPGRPDIVFIDRHLTRTDQMALTATAGCLVSLHRAEGLGLHLMEAMWLGTPVIATRYSGNLHFMDDTNSALVDADLIDVTHGEHYFPSQGQWADPDLDQAAEWMRRMADDPGSTDSLIAAARARMHDQPSLALAGRTIAELSRATRSKGS